MNARGWAGLGEGEGANAENRQGSFNARRPFGSSSFGHNKKEKKRTRRKIYRCVTRATAFRSRAADFEVVAKIQIRWRNMSPLCVFFAVMDSCPLESRQQSLTPPLLATWLNSTGQETLALAQVIVKKAKQMPGTKRRQRLGRERNNRVQSHKNCCTTHDSSKFQPRTSRWCEGPFQDYCTFFHLVTGIAGGGGGEGEERERPSRFDALCATVVFCNSSQASLQIVASCEWPRG